MKLGTGDQIHRFAHQIGRGRSILTARNPQRGQAQTTGRRIKIRTRNCSATTCIPRILCAHQHVAPQLNLWRGAKRGREPARHHRICQTLHPAARHIGNPFIPNIHRANLGPCIRQHQGPHQIQPLHGQPLRNHPANGQPHKQRILHLQMIQQPFHIRDQSAHGVGRGRARRQPMSPLVKPDDPQALRQQRQDRIPQPHIGAQRIGKHHRRPIRWPLHPVMQPHIAGIKHLHHLAPFRRICAMICP